MQKGHAEALAPMVERLMQQQALPFAELSRIAVTVGPGTFTGLRIALSFARGLGLALQVPVIGFSTLEAMAMRALAANPRGLPVVAAIDARRDEAYVQRFAPSGEPHEAPALRSLAMIRESLPQGPVFFIGSAAPLLLREGDEAGLPAYPDARLMAAAAMARPAPDHPPHPLYLRASDAKPQLQLTQGIRLETAGLGHAGMLAQMHALCFAQGWDAPAFSALLANPATQARLALSAEGEPLGFVMASFTGQEAEILTLGVVPKARRRGIAAMLLARFSEELGSLGAARLFLEVAQGNMPALGLYLACGFSEHGRRKAYYASGEDALLLARDC